MIRTLEGVFPNKGIDPYILKTFVGQLFWPFFFFFFFLCVGGGYTRKWLLAVS